jgi:hypothetical protein
LVLSAITSRAALSRPAHDFVAEHAVADIDLAGRRSHDAHDFILDDGRFADARLRMNGGRCKRCQYAKRGNIENVTPIHFITDRLSRHRTGSRACAML